MFTLLEAMARQEGALTLGTRPNRCNNPGDIEFGRFAVAHGATGSDGRFAVFPDLTMGYSAMAALLSAPTYRGLTIRQAIYRWLGYPADAAVKQQNNPNEKGNYPETYIAHVCQWTGLPDSTVIDGHLQLPDGTNRNDNGSHA